MKTIQITEEEAEKIRFCLAKVAQLQENHINFHPHLPREQVLTLMESIETLRALACKITS